MEILTVQARPSSAVMDATHADVVIMEQRRAPRWPVLPLIILPWKLLTRNLEPVSSTALSMPKERHTLLMMAVILGE